MKTYVLTISKVFPRTHKRAGKPTMFYSKINKGEKLHTIRANYNLWKKRIDDVNASIALLSVREWSGKPYQSKQVELFQYFSEHVGIQKLENLNSVYAKIEGNIYWADVVKNDSFSFDDFCDWFKSAKDEPMAVIHFTNFRY